MSDASEGNPTELTTLVESEPEPEHHVDEDAQAVRAVMEWVVVVVGAVALALIVRALLFQPFWIPSESMEQTLAKHDRIMVNKLSYRLGDIGRGDIIVFEPPTESANEYDHLIKRVIGLPGDTVEGRDGAVWVNEVQLVEPYLDPGDPIYDFGPTTVEDNAYFVMGDNRDESADSRVIGTIPESNVVGRAFVRFWPLDRLGTL